MEKVRVTRDEAIQLKSFEHYFPRIIKEMDYGKVIKALRYGYEVKPEFEEGQWVVWYAYENMPNKPTSAFRLRGADRGRFFPDQWPDNFCGGESIHPNKLRHATPEEIAEEKERRFWKKQGRDVWELREDDILDYLGDLLIVDSFDSEEVYFKSNKHDSSPNKYSETPSYVQKNFKVVALAENRLDVSKCLTT